MQLLGKKVYKSRVAIISAIAAITYGVSGIPVRSQEIPSSPDVIIETEPIDSESVTPEELIPETETTLSTWRRPRLVYALPKHQGSIDSLLFSPDSSILISGGGSNDAHMRFWSVETGKELEKIRAQNTAILTMAIDPKTDILVSGGEDAVINLWDWQSGEYQATLFQHRGSINTLKIAPDGKTLVSISHGK